MGLDRREFVALALAPRRRWRVAVIGHTGRGNYGHNVHAAFRTAPAAEVVAVADPVEAGRLKAISDSGARKGYADYREMLREEKPDIVAICPRWLDQRVEMVRAVSGAGAHVLMEKPLAATLKEGDEVLRAMGDRKLQLCHTAGLAPATVEALRLIREGAIGEVLEIRSRGKEDRRAGGEDMMTLGTHCFDLMRRIAGDPVRCSAKVVGPRKEPGEPIGPVAGDSITAAFEFPSGVTGHFASQKNGGPPAQRFGVTVFGSAGAMDFPLGDIPNHVWMTRSPSWRGEWRKIEPPGTPVSTQGEMMAMMAQDLIAAIEANRQPACSARDGLWTLEMVQAVYAASISGRPVALPLEDRRHPLL